MKSSLVQFLIYTAIFLVLGAVIYVFAFFRPNAARIEDLEVRIEAEERDLYLAAQRDEMHPQLILDLTELEYALSREEAAYFELSEAWQANYARFLPETFNEWELRQLIERVVASPHAHGLHIHDFPYSQPLSRMAYNDNYLGLPQGIWVTPVTISFNADYLGLVAILNGFAQENIDNRILRYSLERNGEAWSVNMQLDILTQTPHPYRFNGNYTVY